MRQHGITRGGFMLYKCRRCGGVDDSVHVPSIVWAFTQIDQNGSTKEIPGAPQGWHGLHRCNHGDVYGVSDLVGFMPDPAGESG
jgi:hypothetical protein